jgi:hypothetical protein
MKTFSSPNVRLQAVWFGPLLRLFGCDGSGSSGWSPVGLGSNLSRDIGTVKTHPQATKIEAKMCRLRVKLEGSWNVAGAR